MNLYYSATCLVSTWVSTHSWLVSTLHSVPSSCTLCQTVLIGSTSDKKYRFGVPFRVLTKQVGLYNFILRETKMADFERRQFEISAKVLLNLRKTPK